MVSKEDMNGIDDIKRTGGFQWMRIASNRKIWKVLKAYVQYLKNALHFVM